MLIERILIFFLIFSSTVYSQSIRINEIAASNTIFYDEDGDTPDWIEIYNFGEENISLFDWSISDSENDNTPWKFPEISLNSDEYLVIWASDKDRSQISYARTLIQEGDIFKYVIPNPSTSGLWRFLSFNDSNWNYGNSGFGYADNDDNTNIPPGTISVYLRKKIQISDISKISKLILDIDYDDGFVAYINGIEVARANISGSPPSYDATTLIDHEAQMYNGGIPDRFSIENPEEILVNGENLLAIQIHNISNTSSDMTIIPFLSAIYNEETSEGIPTPSILNLENESLLHTDFKLSSSGESVYLRNSNGDLIDQISYQNLPSNLSYGVSSESEQLFYYYQQTPGYVNDSQEFLGVLENDLTFSHDGGLVDNSFSLEITSQTGSEIRYTSNFTEPDESSTLYTGPIYIPSLVGATIRAKSFQENYISRFSKTRNYSFNSYSDLPIVHLVSDNYNLFDEDYGIYAFGNDYDNNYPYFGANFWQDWERPVHISMYVENELVIDQNAGMKIFGAYSRGWDQKSLAIYARSQYGKGNIEYQIFEDLNYDTFESLVLRNSGNDWMRSNLRDAAITSLMKGSGIDYQSFRTVSTYINNSYWGLYNLREKVSENFIASKHDVNPNEIDLLENNAEIVDGDNSEYIDLINFVEQNNLTIASNYDYVSSKIDIDNFIMYNVAQIYMDNQDWPGNNNKFWKSPGNKWKWILYDTDFGFGGQWWNSGNVEYGFYNNTLDFVLSGNQTNWANPPWATLLIRKLVENNDFKNKFINRYADEMNTRFLPNVVTEKFLSIYDNMYNEMLNHIDRWSDSEPWVDISTVYYYVDMMNNFAIYRQPEAKQHILDQFNLNQYHEVTLTNITPERGYIRVNNNLRIQEQEWNGDYFEDVPITLRAVPESGYEFSHWSGHTESNEVEITLNIEDESYVQAHFIQSSDLNLVINEINYKSSDDFDPGDWIEIYNPNEFLINLSNWVLKDDNDSNTFVFPEGITIEAEGFIVVVRKFDDFEESFPEIENFIGEFDFGLSSSGDAVRLYNSELILQDEVYYESEAPWPDLSNGLGYTLELIDPSYDNSLAESWSNINFSGSPNMPNSQTASLENFEAFESQIYPNPFFETLYTIVTLNNIEFVDISLHDLRARKIKSIFNGKLNPGTFNFSQNFQNISSGVYILKISTSSGYSKSKKVIKF